MSSPASPQPDDWMQAAAQHSQQQFAGNVKRLDKQARRGNYLVGGCIMFFGGIALAIGLIGWARILLRNGNFDNIIHSIDGPLWCTIGGASTVATGWFIWRHRREPRTKNRQNLGGLDVSDFIRPEL